MSDDELYITFYNVISQKGYEKFKPLAERYLLFENIQRDDPILVEHMQLLPQKYQSYIQKHKEVHPDHYGELKGTVAGLGGGPEAFVFIRNALVHGNEEKRRKLKNIPMKAQYQALQLAILYIELTLLYILDYQGQYHKRTELIAGFEQTVPWNKNK